MHVCVNTFFKKNTTVPTTEVYGNHDYEDKEFKPLKIHGSSSGPDYFLVFTGR